MRSEFLLLILFLVAWLLSLSLSYLRKRAQSEARREVDRKAPSVRASQSRRRLVSGGHVPHDCRQWHPSSPRVSEPPRVWAVRGRCAVAWS